MLFELTNAQSTFQRLIKQVCLETIAQFLVVYLDNIVVFSSSLNNHFHYLYTIWNRFYTHQLYAKLKKWLFLQQELKYLGYLIGSGQMHTDPAKMAVIRKCPTPTTNSLPPQQSIFNNFLGCATTVLILYLISIPCSSIV